MAWVGASPAVGEDYIAFAGTDCTGGDLDKNPVLLDKGFQFKTLMP